jgi:hypothetical protein
MVLVVYSFTRLITASSAVMSCLTRAASMNGWPGAVVEFVEPVTPALPVLLYRHEGTLPAAPAGATVLTPGGDKYKPEYVTVYRGLNPKFPSGGTNIPVTRETRWVMTTVDM